VLSEEAFGFTAIAAPGGGIYGQFHRCSLPDQGFSIQFKGTGEHDATDTKRTGAGVA
jgi:hypothetical protein